MSDTIPAPNVLTTAKIGGFTFYIYAYRTLSKAECEQTVDMYMRQRRLKKLPPTGSCKVVTQFGSNGSDGL